MVVYLVELVKMVAADATRHHRVAEEAATLRRRGDGICGDEDDGDGGVAEDGVLWRLVLVQVVKGEPHVRRALGRARVHRPRLRLSAIGRRRRGGHGED